VPFSVKNSNNFTAFVQNMLSVPQNNLFDAAYTIPLIDE
jgi:hypothetical protein